LAELDIVVSEITSNLIKHTTAKGGEILVRILDGKDEEGIEIICIDHGPGMTEPTRMMQDNVSTTGTLGQGLGAIKRLSDEFDMYTLKGWGTIILSRLFKHKKEKTSERTVPQLEVAAILINLHTETVCGDGAAVKHLNKEVHILGVDGLGHGVEANKATKEVVKEFLNSVGNDPASMLRQLHITAKKQRGVVGSVAIINEQNKTLLFCGVGNTAGRMISDGKLVACISYNGIIGHIMPNSIHTKAMDWEKGNLFILCSDGIKTNWDLNKYPGLLTHNNIVIAAAIHKDFCRRTDDSMVIVAGTKRR
jgi:anti-sigma regulatory factor (Ser/Thr protein kinase)